MNANRNDFTNGPWLFVVICLVLLVGSGYLLYNWQDFVQKGLDLEGGVYVLLEAKNVDADESDDAVQRAITIIRNRIDELGVTEPIIQREGDRRIRIELPGIEDQAQAMEIIGRTALLTFVNEDGDVLLTGANLKNASFTRGQNSEPIVALEFDDVGTQLFAQATAQYLNNRIIIMLDNELVSAPTVQAVITDGNAIITGIPSAEEASNIALLLRSGSLPVELEEMETRSVGPLLGENALRLSLIAGVIGFAIVIIYMLFFYRFAGLVAMVSLAFYLAMVLIILALIRTTITLPGLAGLILTIGMAVDANVLIYERIKEELRSGRTILTAINAGFERAFTAIIDANITTIIAGLVLFVVASGSIRGFALVLLVGMVVNLFSACLLSRILMRLAARSKIIKTPGYLGLRGGVI